MKITISTNNNQNIVTLPYVPAGGLAIDTGGTIATDFDSVKYGTIKVLGGKELSSVSIDGVFPSANSKYGFDRGTYKDPTRYVEYLTKMENSKKPMRLVISGKKKIYNKLVFIADFSFGVDKAGNYKYSLDFEEYRKV